MEIQIENGSSNSKYLTNLPPGTTCNPWTRSRCQRRFLPALLLAAHHLSSLCTAQNLNAASVEGSCNCNTNSIFSLLSNWSLYKPLRCFSPSLSLSLSPLIFVFSMSGIKNEFRVEIRSYLAQRVISASLWSGNCCCCYCCGCSCSWWCAVAALIYIQSLSSKTGSSALAIKFKSNIYLNFMHRLEVNSNCIWIIPIPERVAE